MNALAAQNAVQPAGVTRTGEEKIALRVSGAFASEASLRAVTLHVAQRYVPLTDIATISRIPVDPPAAAFRVNGEKALGLAISMAPTGNLSEFGAAVRERMTEIGARLPHGIDMVAVADQSSVVKDAIFGFLKVLVEAIGLDQVAEGLELERVALDGRAEPPHQRMLGVTGCHRIEVGVDPVEGGNAIASVPVADVVDEPRETVEGTEVGLEVAGQHAERNGEVLVSGLWVDRLDSREPTWRHWAGSGVIGSAHGVPPRVNND